MPLRILRRRPKKRMFAVSVIVMIIYLYIPFRDETEAVNLTKAWNFNHFALHLHYTLFEHLIVALIFNLVLKMKNIVVLDVQLVVRLALMPFVLFAKKNGF